MFYLVGHRFETIQNIKLTNTRFLQISTGRKCINHDKNNSYIKTNASPSGVLGGCYNFRLSKLGRLKMDLS